MNTNVVEYLLEMLQSRDDNIFVEAEGGSGKTSSFLEIYRQLLIKEFFYGQQRLIPIYIPLSECDVNSDQAILEYIYKHYDKNNVFTGNDFKEYSVNITRMVLDSDKSDFLFVIMLDAINELHKWQTLISEILELSKMRNVRTIVSSRNNIASFSSWFNVGLSGISDETLEQYIDLNNSDKNTKQLLSIPFYLSKYTELSKSGVSMEIQNINAYTLLSAYYENLLKKHCEHNSRVDIGNSLSYEDNLNYSCRTLLPLICFDMMRTHTLYISSSDEGMIGRIAKSLKYLKVPKLFIDHFVSDTNTIIRSFFVSTGFLVDLDGRYKISHEIYRDFLAAKYITDCIFSHQEIYHDRFKTSPDTLKMLSYSLFKINDICQEDGKFIPRINQTIKIFWGEKGLENDSGSCFSNFTFVYYNWLESQKNGSSQKIEFCKSTVELNGIIFQALKVFINGGGTISENNFEHIRLYAEILRRAGMYQLSLDISAEHMEIARSTNADEKHIKTSVHNAAKCGIYSAFDSAKRADGFDVNVYEEYKKAVDQLKALSDDHYTLSTNLYAMLVSYPDPISKPYIVEYLGAESEKSRKIKGFFLYYDAAAYAYNKDKNDDYYHYPIKQCMVALINRDVSYIGSWETVEYLSIGSILSNRNAFSTYDEAFYQASLCVAEKIIKHLKEKDYSFALECLQAKLMLLRGDTINDEFKTLLQMSSDQIISKFTIFLISKEKNMEQLEKIQKNLKKKADERSPDAFDAVYIQKDLAVIWENIKNRGYSYSAEICEAVRKVLDLKL